MARSRAAGTPRAVGARHVKKLSLRRHTIHELEPASGGLIIYSLSLFTCGVSIACTRANCPSLDLCPSEQTNRGGCQA